MAAARSASKPPRSKLLVVDASVMRVAGGIEAQDPVPARSRDALRAILTICHRVCLSPELRAEWKRHQSRFARGWLTRMYARRKVIHCVPAALRPYPGRCPDIAANHAGGLRGGRERHPPRRRGLGNTRRCRLVRRQPCRRGDPQGLHRHRNRDQPRGRPCALDQSRRRSHDAPRLDVGDRPRPASLAARDSTARQTQVHTKRSTMIPSRPCRR